MHCDRVWTFGPLEIVFDAEGEEWEGLGIARESVKVSQPVRGVSVDRLQIYYPLLFCFPKSRRHVL